MAIHQSGEDYLEAILILTERGMRVRSVDVSRFLRVTKPSVSRAMSILRDNELIEVEGDGTLRLTSGGQAIAESIYERHRFFTDFLTYLGVPPDVAAEDACRLEHVISEESFQKLRAHANQLLMDSDRSADASLAS